MHDKLKILLILGSILLISASPVIAAENNLEINSLTEFSLDIFNLFPPKTVDVSDVHIEQETFKHTDSNGNVEKKINYYLDFNLNDPSDDQLKAKVTSYDNASKIIDSTEETISGSAGDYRIGINGSSKINKSNLVIYDKDNNIVFEGNSSGGLEKTTDEQVDQPAVEKKTEDSSSSATYWGSSKSGKFHYPSCEWGQKIASKNKVVFHSRDEAINSGYVPCQSCNP